MSDGSQVVALSARLFRAWKIKGKRGGVEQSLPACFSCGFWVGMAINRWVSVSFPGVKASTPRVQTLSPLGLFDPRGKTLPAVDRLLPPFGEGRSMAERGKERKEWIRERSKRRAQVLDRLPDRARGFFQRLGGGEQSRVSFSIRHLAWIGSDDIPEVELEMGASRIAKKELR